MRVPPGWLHPDAGPAGLSRSPEQAKMSGKSETDP